MFHQKTGPNIQQQPLVLVVDDDPVVRKVVAAELSAWSMRVTSLSSAGEARELLHRVRPDLVILDVILPDGSGLDLCTELRLNQRYQWVPIILLTVLSDLDKKLEGYRQGADVYITKPFNPKELAALVQARINRVKSLRDHAIRDYVTGLYSRKYFTERLEEEIHHAKRNNRPFCLILLDLDWFKLVNDQIGHMSGDFVLSRFGGFLKDNLRHVDVVARYGGEEFIVLMPETEAEAAKAGIERLRESWLSSPLVEPYYQKILTVTFSAGIAQYGRNSTSPDDLLLAADQALYAAKKAGRNRTYSADQLKSKPELHSPLILVVDDSSLIRHLLEKQLSQKGYRVVTACDGQEALKLAFELQPSLAVVDMVMPKMDGLELTRKLRENPKTLGIKVIALTADNFEGTLLQAFHAGVDDYMNKPFSFPEIEARIQGFLRKRDHGK